MKYSSSNIFSDFEFHDADFKFQAFENNDLTILVKNLNVHKNTEHNPYSLDMELSEAKIVFYNFRVAAFSPFGQRQKGADGKWYTTEPQITFTEAAAKKLLLHELRRGFTVFDFGLTENGSPYFDGICEDPFYAEFQFDSAAVQWDTYNKPAWYEERR